MAAPTVVQHVAGARTTAGTTLSLTWPGATTLGNRLLLIVGASANQLTTTVSGLPAGGSWVLVNPPGKVIRTVTANEQEDLWVYEQRNAPVQSGGKTITVDQTIYFCAFLIEIAGDDIAVSVDQQDSNAGSAQTLLAGTTPPTSVANSLALAAWVSGNKDLHSNLLPGGFTFMDTATSGGVASVAKATLSVAVDPLNATGTQTASVDVAGGFNHSYAACIITIPAVSGSGGGTGGFTPWDDGKVYHGCTLDYFGAGLTLDTNPHALTMAARCKAMVGWAVTARNDFGAFGPAIRAANPSIVLAHYNKSAVRNGTDPGNFGENWYAHTCAGARIPSGSAGLDTMQPDGTVTPTYSDARGFTASTWRGWKAKDMWSDYDVYNAAHTATLNGGYLDSMYSASFRNTNCNSATSTPYTKPEWVGLVRTIADAARTERPALFLLANGLGGGSVYYATNSSTNLPSSGLLDHVDMGLAEGWLRTNYDLYGVWPSLDIWNKCVDMMLDAQVTRGKSIWTITNVANNTSGSPPGNWIPYTASQVNQWRRFTVCTHMLGQRGTAMMEFVSNAPGTLPWAETHAYYNQNLGAPVVTTGVRTDMAYGNGLYNRQYAAGAVVVNPTTGPLNYTVPGGKTYKNPETNALYTPGTFVSVAAHDGVMLIDGAAGGGNPDSPVVTIITPTPGQTYTATGSVVVSGTATDADGIASVTMRLDGGPENPTTLSGGAYSFTFGILPPGAHTVFMTATDANVAPNTVTVSASITVLGAPPPNQPPTLSVNAPVQTVTLPATAFCSVTATDANGVAGVTMSLDGAPAVDAVQAGDFFTFDFGVLPVGNHSITIIATDQAVPPLTAATVRSFVVVGDTGGGTGGGGGTTTGTPLLVSTDMLDVAERIEERGL